MEKFFAILIIAAGVAFPSHADIVKQWTFNSPDNDFSNLTGSLLPSNTSGIHAKTVGGVGNKFGAVGLSATTDPASVDNNTMWRIGTDVGGDSFPTATNANKTTGVEFRVNSSGFGNLQMTWDQENSSSASRYWRVQYTTNGVDWLDHSTVIENISGTAWQLGNAADFSATPGVNNNPNFGVRLVSEFESTATGSGTNAYVGNTGGYGINGTLWLDMVTVTGDDLDPANQFPQVSAIEDVSILVSNTIPPFAFSVFDDQTAPNSLTYSAFSTDPSLVNTFSFGGTGLDRTVTVTPEPGQVGTAAITVRVTDAGGKSTDSSFYLTIFEPTISPIAGQQTSWDVPVTVSFSVTNLPGDPAAWVLTANSSNQNIVADSGIVFEGEGDTRTATISAVPNAIGDTTITIVVTSGDRVARTSFSMRLLPDFVVQYSLSGLPVAAQDTAPATFVEEGLTTEVLSRGATIAPAGLTRGFSANNWTGPNSASNPMSPTRENALLGDYFEFSISVEAGFSASLATLDVSLRRSAINAPMNFEWQYSFDGFATPGTTIVPRGPVWDMLGWNENHFTYLGRSATGTVGSPENYAYMVTRVDSQNEGNAVPTIDLADVAALQNIPGGTTITFRLIAWGNDSTTDSNTVAMGRDFGPYLRGTVVPDGGASVSLAVTRVGDNIQISWPVAAGGTLQGTTTLAPSDWQNVAETPVVQGDQNVVTIVNPTGTRFFRLNQ